MAAAEPGRAWLDVRRRPRSLCPTRREIVFRAWHGRPARENREESVDGTIRSDCPAPARCGRSAVCRRLRGPCPSRPGQDRSDRRHDGRADLHCRRQGLLQAGRHRGHAGQFQHGRADDRAARNRRTRCRRRRRVRLALQRRRPRRADQGGRRQVAARRRLRSRRPARQEGPDRQWQVRGLQGPEGAENRHLRQGQRRRVGAQRGIKAWRIELGRRDGHLHGFPAASGGIREPRNRCEPVERTDPDAHPDRRSPRSDSPATASSIPTSRAQ
jgi:hypothetical protein